ncbi:hypothetical protein GGI19_004329 [Coemansia pectinata]|uniref:Uncharacterized protein n=1 Tax=Coemansia pectinata TaxID=1052879 RepID=A0A9W8LAN5_9FUNG|nr:hypothetical protein GGI19_004329 [Coemansia pectinata]
MGYTRIKVDAPAILEGKALKLLSTEPYNGCAFCWARKLIFDIVTDRSYDEDDGRLPPDTYDNVLAFVQRIKEMAPRVGEVSLDIGDADGNLATIIGKHTCFLLLNLSMIAKKTLFTNGCKQLVACPDLALVCKLSCIDCNIDEDGSRVLQLARLNALTLQTIKTWSYYEVDISGLIRDDDDGNYVVYPYLHTLELYVSRVPTISQRLTFKGAVPFPSLWSLILRSHSPFGDDVVFRGNGATLEYLKVALYPELVTILERHVFTRTSHPQLKCVDTGLLSSHTLRSFATAAAYLRFVMGIAPGAPVRVVDYRLEKIALYAWDIYSGKALQQLSSAPYDGCAFPLVRVLTFNIRFVDDYLSEDQNINSPPGTEANILAFVQRVKEMAPRVHEIYQNVGDTDYELLEDYGVHTTLLVSQLYGIAETTVISKRNRDLVVSPGLAPIGNLTSIVYDLDWLDYRVSALIRQSSQSLQTLHIRVNETSDISGLIRDPVDGGKYIEYPRLHTLNIHGSDAGQRRGFNGVVLFPGLRRLTLLSRYPFDDDVLFRGNGATLEYLKVVLYSETVGLLRKYNVFTPTSHPNLRACIYSVRHNEPIAFDTASDYMKFALSIAPAASVRVLPYLREFGEPLVPTLSLLGNHASIQVLSMDDINMSLWDVLTLIKSLPLLSDLYAGYPTLDEYPQGVTEAALPEYVISNYAPMGKRFRCWHFQCSSMDDLDGAARCMLLLALACPNFDYVVVDIDHREWFTKDMRKQIAEPWFNLYAPRLQRLLRTDNLNLYL